MSVTRRNLLTTGLAGAATLSTSWVARSQPASTIELWTFLDPNARGTRSELLKEMLADFEHAHPGTTVRSNIIQWTEISPQLLRASRAGNVPDVVTLFSPYMASHVKARTLQPLDPMMAAWAPARRDDTIVLPIARNAANQTFALPWELRVYGLLYRLDLLQAAGLQPPATLDDLAKVALALQKPGLQGLALSLHPATSTTPIEFLMPQMIAQGTPIVRPDGAAAFAGPGAERVLQALHDLVYKHKVLAVDTALMPSDDVQSLGISGQAAIMMNGSHRLTTVQERSPAGAKWSFEPFPPLDAGKPAPASMQGWTLAIPQRAKNPQLAWKLIDHWTSAPVQKAQAVRAGYLPAVRSVASDPAFTTGLNTQFRLPETIAYAAQHPLSLNWPENSDALNDALGRVAQQVITNRMSPAEALVYGEKVYDDLRR